MLALTEVLEMTYRPHCSGDLEHMPIIELAQMAATSKRNASFGLLRGNEQGLLVIEEGAIVHAILVRDERGNFLRGDAAARELLTWERGRFHIDFGPACWHRTMDASYEHTALAALVELDHRHMSEGRTGSGDHVEESLDELIARLRPRREDHFRPCHGCPSPCELSDYLFKEEIAWSVD